MTTTHLPELRNLDERMKQFGFTRWSIMTSSTEYLNSSKVDFRRHYVPNGIRILIDMADVNKDIEPGRLFVVYVRNIEGKGGYTNEKVIKELGLDYTLNKALWVF